jgi:hypothetical protein
MLPERSDMPPEQRDMPAENENMPTDSVADQKNWTTASCFWLHACGYLHSRHGFECSVVDCLQVNRPPQHASCKLRHAFGNGCSSEEKACCLPDTGGTLANPRKKPRRRCFSECFPIAITNVEDSTEIHREVHRVDWKGRDYETTVAIRARACLRPWPAPGMIRLAVTSQKA